MVYNFYYTLASAIFLVFILFCLCFKLTERTKQNFRFIRLIIALLASCIIEVVSTISFQNVTSETVTLNMVLTALDFLTMALTVYFYGLYIEGFIHEGQHKVTHARWVNRCILSSYVIAHIVNLFRPVFFYFDADSVYRHGKYYICLYIFPMYFVVYGIVLLIVRRKNLSFRQFFSMLAFSILIVSAASLQYVVMPYNLISLFAGTCGIIIVFFFLETPDFRILLNTMEDLKKAEEVAQEERVKAYAANQAKSSFLANVSHEIRTPINAVLGMNEMILRETSEDAIREYAMDVNNAGRSLLAIINDILDISKIEAGKMEVIPADYNLADMIDALASMTIVRAEKKGLEFKLEVDNNLPSKLHGDDIRLKQIIMNLLSNGVKYTNEGTVTLNISGDKKGDKELLHVIVQDTGMGIKEEDIENLFKAFHRLDEQTNRSVEGTGLGMSIANELLNLMGSEIQLNSVYGEGSTFYFDVEQEIVDETPIGDIDTVLKTQANTYSHTIGFTAPDANILVVDDNSINRKVVIGLLKEIGCSIDEAGGGYECVDMVKQKHYDLIFLDHLMPDLDGVGTLEKIKSEENLCNETPVIAFTANAISGMKESFLATGFNDFISKPVDSTRLEEIVHEFLPKEMVKEGEIILGQKKSAPAEKQLMDLDDFDFRYARVCLGEADLIMSVASDFYDQAARIESALNSYMTDLDNPDNMSRYRTDVHALKSTSRMLGEITLSGLAKTSEDAAKASDKQTVTILHPMILAELNKAKQELEQMLPKKEEITKVTLDENILKSKLKELETALDNRDVKAQDAWAQDIINYEFDDEIGPMIEQLVEYIKILKMLKAKALLAEILNKLEE